MNWFWLAFLVFSRVDPAAVVGNLNSFSRSIELLAIAISTFIVQNTHGHSVIYPAKNFGLNEVKVIKLLIFSLAVLKIQQ